MDNFLIIRLSSLGDIIHTLPAFLALRKNFPQAKISWVVAGNGKEILDLVPGLDKIIVTSSPGWRRKIKNKNQVALDFQGLLKSGLIAFLSRARKRTGFSRKNLKEPLASFFYTDRLEPIPEDGHVISKNLKLLSKIGIHEDRFEFPLQVPEELSESVRKKLRAFGYSKDKKLIVYNLGAAWETKRWFPEKWAKLIEIVKNEKLFPVLLWGNEKERELALAVNKETGVPPAPFFTVKEVIALLKESALLVSGDTFALQAACALSVPVVGIFGPTNPGRNGPFSPTDKIVYHQLECNPCYQRTCRTMECLKKISPEEVAVQILQTLEKNG
jgi:lipopolysaccharide heptosyltransferase I